MIKTAVITGGHSFQVQPFHELFRTLPGVNAYIQHLDDFASSPQEVRDDYDVVVFYIMPRGKPDDDAPWYSGKPKNALENLGDTRQGIVILHHAVLAYPDWPVWDEIVGMEKRVISSYHHGELVPVHVSAPEHPILNGIASWELIDETYVVHEPRPENEVLLTTDHPLSMRSLAWTRTYRNARVFCNALGHDQTAFEDANFKSVLANGIQWVSPSVKS